jgi:hypothetical protein
MSKRFKFYEVEDIRNDLVDFCSDQEIDPAAFLERADEIREDWEHAFEGFLECQRARAERFKDLYGELDMLDWADIYQELKGIQSKKEMVQFLLDKTKTIRSMIKKGDSQWIQHRNYVVQLMDDFIPRWGKKTPENQKTILEIVSAYCDLDDDSQSDE